MGQHLSGIVGKFAEQIVFGGGQMHLVAAGAYLPVREINDQAVGAAAAIDGA